MTEAAEVKSWLLYLGLLKEATPKVSILENKSNFILTRYFYTKQTSGVANLASIPEVEARLLAELLDIVAYRPVAGQRQPNKYTRTVA
jgi:hypothetical protein